MQTYLHGRDLIGDLDFSKEEVETVLDSQTGGMMIRELLEFRVQLG